MDEASNNNSLGLKIKITLVVLVLAVIAFAVVIKVFKVENVIVEGNERYTEDQIKDMCLGSPLAVNSLLFSTLVPKIDLSDVAFLDHVTVEYVDPQTIRLTVVETQLVGYFLAEGHYYYFDQNGRVTEVLTSPDEEEGKHVPLILGLAAENIGLNHIIKFEKPKVLNTITAIRHMIDQHDICPDSVHFDGDLNIELKYGNITVNIGEDNYLEEKMARVAAILPELAGFRGTLHLETYSSETANIVFDFEKGWENTF